MKAISARTVILDSSIWRSELAGELVRLGIPAEAADAGAVKTLQHICARAGWPREVFRVANQAPTDEEVAALMAAGELEREVVE